MWHKWEDGSHVLDTKTYKGETYTLHCQKLSLGPKAIVLTVTVFKGAMTNTDAIARVQMPFPVTDTNVIAWLNKELQKIRDILKSIFDPASVPGDTPETMENKVEELLQSLKFDTVSEYPQVSVIR